MENCHHLVVTKTFDVGQPDLFSDGSIQGVSAKENHDNTDNRWYPSPRFHYKTTGNVKNWNINDLKSQKPKKPAATSKH